MTFNIWLGGELVDFGKVVEAIRAADADIVGLQEATGNTRRLADALGWYANERLQIISHFPLIDPPKYVRKIILTVEPA
jgi:endonuclease/exonuclease/phosphatase family metal-dependent hydrolase